ncbi:outer membrane protein assembly factor BamA [Buchnera aphidicola (Takecallis taiwana)]|uniref:outer membrane protein assembly factor BamA n=1 Tax=Buchnera aphidicola TaxID=9 RepID=UPI0031B6B795
MKIFIMRMLLAFVLCFYSAVGIAENKNSIKIIQFVGLHNISKSEVLHNMQINQDHTMTANEIQDNTAKLLAMGVFSDVIVSELNDSIVFKCEENPIISKITCIGNMQINQNIIFDQCKKNNIKINHIFNKNSLNILQNSLQKLYEKSGIDGTKINISYQLVSSNTMILQIQILEGVSKLLDTINIIGNNHFSSYKIISLFTSYPSFFQRHILHNKKFDNAIFSRDLEALKHFYYENGYIDFNITDVKFLPSKNKKNIVINITIDEGEQYVLSSCRTRGNIEHYDSIFKDELVSIKLDSKYNLYDIIDIKNRIQNTFFNLGFLKCQIVIHTVVDKQNKCVNLYFDTDLGSRFIINKIDIQGNTFTKTEFLHHIVNKISLGQYANLQLINQGKYDLENTGYVQNVTINYKILPNSIDKVDIIYIVQEKKTNSYHVNTGYNITDGMHLKLQFRHNNWFGCGIDTISNLFHSHHKNNIDFILQHPNIVHDVILSHRIFYNTINIPDKKYFDLLKKNYGFEENITFLKLKNHIITVNVNYNQDDFAHVQNAISKKQVYVYKLHHSVHKTHYSSNSHMIISYSWLYNTIPNVHFSHCGKKVLFSGKFVFENNNRNFHQELFTYEEYFKVFHSVKYVLHTYLSSGIEFPMNTTCAPYYEGFHMQGVNNIRGFVDNSIGYKAILICKNHDVNYHGDNTIKHDNSILFGGNSFIIGKLDLIVPNFFIFIDKYDKFFQTSLFLDVGSIKNIVLKNSLDNIFKQFYHYHNIDNNLHASTGIEIVWDSVFGPIDFSYSYPLIYNIGDLLKSFQCHMHYRQ